jgi:hypothetical protein
MDEAPETISDKGTAVGLVAKREKEYDVVEFAETLPDIETPEELGRREVIDPLGGGVVVAPGAVDGGDGAGGAEGGGADEGPGGGAWRAKLRC